MKKLLLVTLLVASMSVQSKDISEASLLSGLLGLSVVVVVSGGISSLLNDISTQSSNKDKEDIKSIKVTEVAQKENDRTMVKSIVRVGNRQESLDFELDTKKGVNISPGDFLNVEKINSDYLLTKGGKALVLVQGSEKTGNFRQKKFE